MVRPTKVGVVVSQGKMDKTVKVRIRNTNWNRHVSKYIVSHRNMLVHDELNKCREGDIVRLQYVRPLSPKKSWAVAEFMKLQGTSWEKYLQEIPSEVRREEVQKLEEFQELRRLREAHNGEDPQVSELRSKGSDEKVSLEIDKSRASIDALSTKLDNLSFMSAEAKRILKEEPKRAIEIIQSIGKDPSQLNPSIKRNLIRKFLSENSQVSSN